MLTEHQFKCLEAFGQIVGNVDVVVSLTCSYSSGQTGYILGIRDLSGQWVDIEGTGFTVEEAYRSAVAKFEAHPLGCSEAEVEMLLAEEARISLIEDISGLESEDVRIEEGPQSNWEISFVSLAAQA